MPDTLHHDDAAVSGSQHPLVLHLLSALESISACEHSPSINPCGDEEVGLHCGVEDVGCGTRYEGANYGYARGVERGIEWASKAAGHAIETMQPCHNSAWIDVRESKPPEETEVLTLMKHGSISGYYDAEEDVFRGYYWHDMQWSARYWMPLPISPQNAGDVPRGAPESSSPVKEKI